MHRPGLSFRFRVEGYQATGRICGISLPAGLRESDRLDRPIFTPSTKAEMGTHDENVTLKEVAKLLG